MLGTLSIVIFVISFNVNATPGNKKSLIACDGDTVNIDCGNDSVIIVNDGFYGRNNHTTCGVELCKRFDTEQRCLKYHLVDDECQSPWAPTVIKYICNMKSNCTFNVTTLAGYGDPCAFTYKYAKIDYVCITKI